MQPDLGPAPGRPRAPLRPYPEAAAPGELGFLSEILRAAQTTGHPFTSIFQEARPSREPALVRALKDLGSNYLLQHGLSGVVDIQPALPEVEAPEGLLRSVLEHLVEGSLRDNPSARPYCHVGVSHEDEATVTLYLRDNGVPLPETSIEGIRQFLRASTVSKTPDRVYRLFLAQNLLSWLNGSLWVGPSPGDRGATVFLRLPKAAAAMHAGTGQ